MHTGIFAQNSFQNDSINSRSTSKKLLFWLKIVKIIQFLTLKPIKGTLGIILKMLKKIARWRHKSEISKRNVKTMISPLLFRLHCLTLTIPKFDFIFIYGLYYGGSCSTTLQYNVLQAWGYHGFTLLYFLIACSSVHYSALSFNRFTP